MAEMVAAVRAVMHLGRGAPPAAADALLDITRAKRGELREARVWLRARPEWIEALERHRPLLPAHSGWRSAVHDLLQLVRDDPDAPDIDAQPEAIRRAAEARTAQVANWRTQLTAAVLGNVDPSPESWMIAVVDALWTDERVRHEFPHEAAVGERLLETLELSARAFIDHALEKDEGEEEEEERDATAGLADIHPRALEALLSLNDDLIHLRRNPWWLDTMNAQATQLPPGRWADAMACLHGVVEHLDETAPKPSPSPGGTYFNEGTPVEEALRYESRPQRFTVTDISDSLYMRKHWRRELRRIDGMSESFAAWIEATAMELWTARQGSPDEATGPHLIAWRVLEMVSVAAAVSRAPGGLTALQSRAALRVHLEFLDRHPDWKSAMARHSSEMEDNWPREAVRALLSGKAAGDLQQVRKPIDPDTWREDLRIHLPGNELLLSYLSAVASDLWADPRGREEFEHEADIAGRLLMMIADAGMAYVVPDSVSPAERDTLLMRFLERSANGALNSETLEWLAQRSHWLAVMERHAGLLGTDEATADAVARLALAARAHELQPVRGPSAAGDWRARVQRRVSRLGAPEFGPFFLDAVARAWETPSSREEFADEYELYEKLEEVVLAIAAAAVIPRLTRDHPELAFAMSSAADPSEARRRAREEIIPWLRSHGECVAAMRAGLQLIPRGNLFRLYVEATVAAASGGPGPTGTKARKRRRR